MTDKKLEIVGMLADTSNVIAMGTIVMKKGKWFTTKISVDLLKRAIKTIDTMGVEEIQMVYSEKSPLILGNINEKKNSVSGIIIADRDEPK